MSGYPPAGIAILGRLHAEISAFNVLAAGCTKRYAGNFQRTSLSLSMLKSVKRPDVSNRIQLTSPRWHYYLLMRTRAGCIRRPDRRTGSQSSTSEPHSGKSANMMIMVAHAAGILRRLQDFLPGLTCAADEGRAKFFRPVYFRCPFERAPTRPTCADCRGHALGCGRITPTSWRPAPL